MSIKMTKGLEALARKLSVAVGTSAMLTWYSDTAYACGWTRFEPDGSTTKEEGWDRQTMIEVGIIDEDSDEGEEEDSVTRFLQFAKIEKFIAGWGWLEVSNVPDVSIDYEYPTDAFEGMHLVTK